MRCTLIHNPTAGDGSVDASDLVKMIEGEGFQVRYESTKKAWKKALRQKADLIAAAGGDGTVAKVMRAAVGIDAPIAILPLGTANNVARTLGLLEMDGRQLVSGWKTAAPQPFDVGVVTCGKRRELFVEGCGGGVFATAIARAHLADRAGTFLGHGPDRALNLVRQVVDKARAEAWDVSLDGRDLSGDYLLVEMLNIRFSGPSVPVATRAQTGDGTLDVVLATERDRGQLLEHVASRLSGDGGATLRLPAHRSHIVKLRRVSHELRVDDRLKRFGTGSDPQTVEVGVLAGALRVLVPAA